MRNNDNSKLTAFIAASLILAMSLPAGAYWLMDGRSLCSDPSTQNLWQCIPDGSGGMIAVWLDWRIAETNVALQKIDPSGTVQYDANGMFPEAWASTQDNPYIVPDGGGDFIAVWQDDILDIDDIFLGDSIYVFAWKGSWPGNDYRFVCPASSYQTRPMAAEDGSGGVIVAWQDDRGGLDDNEIYVQRLAGADGSLLWTAAGVTVSTYTGEKTLERVIPDGESGAIVVWEDTRNGYWELFAQRLDSLGTALWPPGGVQVCGIPYSSYQQDFTCDDLGGLILVWTDRRAATTDVYAQHITPAGAVDWGPNGMEICAADGFQSDPVITADGKGGSFIAWVDPRSGVYDIYAQRLSGFGTPMWTADGIPIAHSSEDKNGPEIAYSSNGYFFVSWLEPGAADLDLRVQKYNSSGAAQWDGDGVLLCSSEGGSQPGYLVADGSGGVLAAWTEYRYGNPDIFAGRVLTDGTLGWEPSLDSAADLPGDEGGWVRLSVSAPTHDNAGVDYYQVIGYNIWRRIDGVTSPLSASDIYCSPPERLFAEASEPGDILRAPAAVDYDFPPGDWESIGYSAARQLPSYLFAVPTRSDSTSDGIPWEHYVVTIHTTDPAYYFIVGPDSAYSVDNLAPAQPLGLAGEALEGPPGIELTWEQNGESDLSHYEIYRGTSAIFEPGESNRIGESASPSFSDDWPGWYESWYKVAAVDRHGNIGPAAILGPGGMVTGDDPMPVPSETFLSQNFPNPFNPATTIAFGLKAGGHVSLKVFDAAGRLVSTLIDGSKPAGEHAAVWNGKDNAGARAASGIYFYMLQTEGFTETRKMVMIR